MKNVSRRGIFLVSIFIICAVVVLWRRFGTTNTSNPEQQSVRDSLYQQKRVLLYNKKVYSKVLRLADDGDIVVRLGTDPTGGIHRKLNEEDASYSQAGVICREHDTVFVYYAPNGEFSAGLHVQRETLWSYGHPEKNERLGIYRVSLNSFSGQRLATIIKQTYQQSITTDTSFGPAGNGRLNSARFVAYCIENALQKTGLFHGSAAGNKKEISIDDITGNNQVKKIAAWAY